MFFLLFISCGEGSGINKTWGTDKKLTFYQKDEQFLFKETDKKTNNLKCIKIIKVSDILPLTNHANGKNIDI